MKKMLIQAMVAVLLVSPISVFGMDKDLLIIVTTGDRVTQLMSLVLGIETGKKGADVSILLCGQAGSLAIEGAEEIKLKPKGVSPQMLLQKLIAGGTTVELCPPYLPNSSYSKADLRKGVAIAKPPEIATRLLDENTKILSY